jgi:mono/diheme cytochrome c family protein
LRGRQRLHVLLANCGQCHGPLAPATNSGGINFIDDLDRLVAAGLIVPLRLASSRIVIVMRDGSMPPPGPGSYPVTEAEMNIVTQYIDNPRFWPDVAPPSEVDAGVEVPLAHGGADGG